MPYIIDVWTSDEGLPQNSVISMIQTRDGYLWLGTLDGLVRFDGIRFTIFDENNTPGLNSSQIVHLFEDSQNRLWIGTETAGVALAVDGEITSLGLGQGSREGRLVATCEDASGAVWLYTANGELWRYHQGQIKAFQIGVGIPSYSRSMILEKDSGWLWVGTDRRLLAFDPLEAALVSELEIKETLKVNKLDYLLASQDGGYWRLADGRVTQWRANQLERDLGAYTWNPARIPIMTACEDQQGGLLVGTKDGGIFWYDANGKVNRLSSPEVLSHNTALSLCVDREGSLWVGTDGGGVNRVKRKLFELLPESLGFNIQSVCEDAAGGLWVGYNGWRVERWFEGQAQRFDLNSEVTIRAVYADQNQQVWLGTYGSGLFHLQNGQFQRVSGPNAFYPVVQAIHQDRKGRLWLGTRGGLALKEESNWRLFTSQEGLSVDVVRAIADDAEGNLWIGTEMGGLNRLRDGQFSVFHKSNGLPSEDISALCVDEDDVLWIGTSSGLARLHQGQWTRYTTQDGLLSNGIRYLIDGGRGNLWIGSNAGLMRVPKIALNDFARGSIAVIPCRAYGKQDGLPTGECSLGSQPAAWRTQKGRLWFPTIKGLVSVDPSELKLNTNPPPVMIERILVDSHLQNTNGLRAGRPQRVIIPAGKERLEIHYTSLNLAAPDRARFKFRMDGYETDWTEAGNMRVARYSRLPPGHYLFQVTASNEDGVWNPAGHTLAVTVIPPFWRTWWFMGAAAIFLLGAIVAVVHYLSTQKLQRELVVVKQQEALEKERTRIARDIHDQLGASLTQVGFLGEMIESDKELPGEVEAHAQQISQTARETARALDEIVWAVNPSNDTVDGLITYLCKNAQEYLSVAGLRYRLDVPSELPATPIPPDVRHNVFLAAKESVTNVVKHASASEVWIRLALEPARFTLEIEDNGVGLEAFDEKKAITRNGLSNMRKRMEEIGGSFSIAPGPQGGTLVRLVTPLEKN